MITTTDHSCCFNQENPACGQKIKHFECCLCKREHPDIDGMYVRGILDAKKMLDLGIKIELL